MAKKKSSKSKSQTQAQIKLLDLTKMPRVCDDGLRLTWVDRMEFSARAGETPVCTMQFFSAIPNQTLQEVARLQMANQHARAIADVLCRSLDYYPEKTEPAEKAGKGKTKKRKSK